MLMDNARGLFADTKKFSIYLSRSEFIQLFIPFNKKSIVERWNKYNRVLV